MSQYNQEARSPIAEHMLEHEDLDVPEDLRSFSKVTQITYLKKMGQFHVFIESKFLAMFDVDIIKKIIRKKYKVQRMKPNGIYYQNERFVVIFNGWIE